MIFSLHFESFVYIVAQYLECSLYVIQSSFWVKCMHYSLVIGVFIVCYLAIILSHLYALQRSTWSVDYMLFSPNFMSFVCIAAWHF